MTISDTPGSTYCLRRMVLGSSATVPIGADEYTRIDRAKTLILEVLDLEEKYELVVGNFTELERSLNDIVLNRMLRRDYGYPHFNDARVLVNQRTLNLLSATRLYLDHAPQHCANIHEWFPEISIDLPALRNEQHAQSAAYRIADALRNLAQHRTFPVASLSIGSQRIERQPADDAIHFHVEAWLDVEALKTDPKTPKALREELQQSAPPKLDARPILREYVARIGRLHQAVRQQIQSVVRAQEELYLGVIERFQTAHPDESSLAGLAAVEFSADGRRIRDVGVFPELVERRRYFERRNGGLDNLVNWHLVTEAPRGK